MINKYSFFILLITYTFLSQVSLAQHPFMENTVWKTSQRVIDSFEEVVLTSIDPNNYSRDAYYRIEFKPNNEFTSYNIPGCGLDCIIHVNGSYAISGETIQFTTNKISKFKSCSGDTILNKNIGVYYWIQDDYGLRLVKNLDDEPKENYFKKNKIKVPKFKDDEAKELVQMYIYEYNRIYEIVKNKNTKKIDLLTQEISQWRNKASVYVNAKNTEERLQFGSLRIDWLKKLDILVGELRK